MAGHSKWANIQHRKGAQDAKRGKLFTKLIREITVAARIGGGDPDSNPRLRAAIDKALGGNMTRDTIERAVKRGSGDLDGEDYEEVTYEGYGPNGVAVMVECLTDNRNRTVAEVRHAFNKHNGNLGTSGSVAYLFTKLGQIILSNDEDEDKVIDIALNAGAEDVITDALHIEVTTTPDNYHNVVKDIIKAGLIVESSELTMHASLMIELDKDGAEKLLRLVDMLEDLDDVQNVYTNADISDDIMSELYS